MSFINSRKRKYSSVECTTNDVGLTAKHFLPFGRVSERVSRFRSDDDAVEERQENKVKREHNTILDDTRTLNAYSRVSFSTSEFNRSSYRTATDAQLGLVSSVTASRQQQSTKSTPSKESLFYPIKCLRREELPHPNKLRKKASIRRKSISNQWKREDGVQEHIQNLHRKQTHRPVSSTAVPYQCWTATARKNSTAELSYPWTQKSTCMIVSSADSKHYIPKNPFYSHSLVMKEPSTRIENHYPHKQLSACIRNRTPHSSLSVTVDNDSLYASSGHFGGTGLQSAFSAESHIKTAHPTFSANVDNYSLYSLPGHFDETSVQSNQIGHLSVQLQSSSKTLHSGLSDPVYNRLDSGHFDETSVESTLSANCMSKTLHSGLSEVVDNPSLHTISEYDGNHSPYREPFLRHPSLESQPYHYRYNTQFSYKERAINIPVEHHLYRSKFSDTPTFRYARRISEE